MIELFEPSQFRLNSSGTSKLDMYFFCFSAISIMKQDYKEGEMTLADAKQLAVKIFSKTLDLAQLTSDKMELAQLTKDEEGNIVSKVLPKSEVDQLIKVYEAKRDAEEKEKKDAAGSSK